VEKRKILAPTRNQVLIASFTACALYWVSLHTSKNNEE
jgi:hypothetical protein